MIIVLDNVPLNLITNPNRKKPETIACQRWLEYLISNRILVCLPEIVYYETRRQLMLNKWNTGESGGLIRLEEFKNEKAYYYQPITTEIIIKATELWAWARKTNQSTAHEKALDGDVILAATAIVLAQQEEEYVLVATDNIKDIERYTPAKRWQEILKKN
jgi:hypothetical protein